MNQRHVEAERKLAAGTIMPDGRKQRQFIALRKKEGALLRLNRTKMRLTGLRNVKVIGKGAFGEVRVAQKVDTSKICAMKSLKKDQHAHVHAERDVLAKPNSPWVVQLYFPFQDPTYLCLIMEFLAGGDLMTMLIKYDTFSEGVTRFYITDAARQTVSIQTAEPFDLAGDTVPYP